jgi:ABC-type glycerol-3-phosphate transport system substrate-binding protein
MTLRAHIGVSVAVLAVAGAIAGCGSTKASDPAAQVKSTWTTFFDGSTPASKRV